MKKSGTVVDCFVHDGVNWITAWNTQARRRWTFCVPAGESLELSIGDRLDFEGDIGDTIVIHIRHPETQVGPRQDRSGVPRRKLKFVSRSRHTVRKNYKASLLAVEG